MIERYEETTAQVHYDGTVELSLAATAVSIADKLSMRGIHFDEIGTVADYEIQLVSPSLIVSVLCDEADRSCIHVSAETPVSQGKSRKNGDRRFTAAADTVRHFISHIPARNVVWQHRGSTHVTAPHAETTTTTRRIRSPLEHVRQPEAIEAPIAACESQVDWSHGHTVTSGDNLIDLGRAAYNRRPVNRHGVHDVRRIRPALPVKDHSPTAEKLTIYALGTTVMVMSLPVGAGLMTYNLLRGGTINGTSRIMALTGMGVGLSVLPATRIAAATAQDLLPFALSIAGTL